MTAPPLTRQAYQLLPALDAEQRDALRQSIEANGILQPIEVDETGRILDGHHRAAIAAELGIACPSRTVEGLDDEAGKRRYAITVNLMRRQLDKTMRGALVAQLRAEGMSVRAIAQETGIPKSEVGRAVHQLSQLGQLDQPEKVTGLDGKERSATQPSRIAEADDDSESVEQFEDPTEPAHDGPVGNEQGVVKPAMRETSRPTSDPSQSTVPALPWPVADDHQPEPADDSAHAARVSNDVRRLITLAQTFGSEPLRRRAIELYADNLGNAPMPPSGVVNAQELRMAADAIAALAKDWKKKR